MPTENRAKRLRHIRIGNVHHALQVASISVTVEQALGSRYVLEERISSGGMGEIWRGRDLAADQAVAVKVLHEQFTADPTELTRFVRERTILTGLHHPNLVPVRDMIMEGSRLALVMDLVEGPDLHHYLGAEGPLAPTLAATLISQACEALAVVHAAGIVHRDLKPSNILLDTSQSPPIARLTDFGIARAQDALPLTASDVILGTPQYCAPEVVAGEPGGPAVDIYAAGTTLYELLTGQPPFAGGPASTVFWRHLEAVPLRPQGMPEPLWTVIAGCLAKDPDQRPSATTAAQLLRDCLPVLRDALPADPAPGARRFRLPSRAVDEEVDPQFDPPTPPTEEVDHQFDPPTPTMAVRAPSPADKEAGFVRRRRRPLTPPAPTASRPGSARFSTVAGVATVLTAGAGLAIAAWLASNYGYQAPRVPAGSRTSVPPLVMSQTAWPEVGTPGQPHRTPPPASTRHARVTVPAAPERPSSPPSAASAPAAPERPSSPPSAASAPAAPVASSRPASPAPPRPSDALLQTFEDGTTDGWQAGPNVASVAAVTSFLNGPGHPYDGNYVLEASTNVAIPVSSPRTMSFAPAAPLDLSAAQSFFVAVDGYGGAPGATGYTMTITLSSGNEALIQTTSVQPNTWTKLVLPISTWTYRSQITSISVSFAGVGSTTGWAPQFQIDDVGYTT
jgi:serine/threonine protein kinase